MKEGPLPKAWTTFLVELDIAVKHGLRDRVPIEFMEAAAANRVRRPPTVVGGDEAADGGSGLRLTSYGVRNGKVVPIQGSDMPAWTKHLERTASEQDNFQRLLRRGLIPQ